MKRLHNKCVRGTATEDEKDQYVALAKKAPPICKTDVDLEYERKQRLLRYHKTKPAENTTQALYDKCRQGMATR